MLDEAKARHKASLLCKEFEGLRLIPYLCPAGLLTVGWGHRTGSRKIASMEEAVQWLEQDVKNAFVDIGVDVLARINTNQAAALCSFVFNVGQPRWEASTLRRLILSGDKKASGQFLRWVKAKRDGVLVTLPGLVERREAEQTLFDCLRDL